MSAAASVAADRPEVADRAAIAGRLALVVGRINRRIRPAGDGLSHGLLSALSTIVRKGPLRPGDLARIEVVAAPTITRAVADLENRGMVARATDPGDGRSFLLTATEAGIEAVLRARWERAERVGALLADRSDAEIALIAAALDALEATATAP
jgi:Transcriptional regulators